MKVVFASRKTEICFEELSGGDLFKYEEDILDATKGEDQVLMKLSFTITEDESLNDYNAVNIEDGELYYISDDDVVIPLKGTLTVSEG